MFTICSYFHFDRHMQELRGSGTYNERLRVQAQQMSNAFVLHGASFASEVRIGS
ncbi:hypothetical protein PGTUg99_037203 [Puccinia graminis f. sp. tritici]|uniref:Uncharacterized protein n=1 Tax=Puccinia graminis f. sp. tritici TaxID=56615 RepID=A0A5B0SLX3_PUCGR|nr:hypothetical protein PGTUg99_037203 [Puccinia graminis f. sp. tritici]